MSQYASLQPGMQPVPTDPAPRSCVENGRRYELQVVQQPKRARMCGFGDKDRRPITPPPCVRLLITYAATGKEVDCNDIDHSMFVLNVDLWSEEGVKEVNLVKHSSTSPSIGNIATVPYGVPSSPTDQEHTGPRLAPQQSEPYNSYPSSGPPQNNPYGPPQPGPSHNQPPHADQEHGAPRQPEQYNQYPQSGSQYGQSNHGPPPHGPAPQAQSYGSGPYQPGYAPNLSSSQYQPATGYGGPQTSPVYFTTGAGIHAQGHAQALQSREMGGYPPTPVRDSPLSNNLSRGPISNTQPTGMFTRNLIGSLAASAFRLTDPDDRIGIWFVLQDLSVRTEGHFRLRFSFVNVGTPPPPEGANSTSGQKAQLQNMINTTRAPVLAACFSDVFTVFSAKKFPGVVESTGLSKCFATQGIKIPIRKEGPGGKDKGGRDEYDED